MDFDKVIQLITAVVSLASVLGLGTYFNTLWKRKDAQFTEREKAFKDMEKSKRQKDIREIVQEEMSGVQKEITEVKTKIVSMTERDEREDTAIQAILRDRLYEISSMCLQKGYTTQEDRDNFLNLYDKYHNLGKNGCMDIVKEKFLALMTEEEFLRK